MSRHHKNPDWGPNKQRRHHVSIHNTGSTRTAQRQAQTHYAVLQKLQGQRQAAQRPSQTQQAIEEQKTSRTSNQAATGASSTSARSARPRARGNHPSQSVAVGPSGLAAIATAAPNKELSQSHATTTTSKTHSTTRINTVQHTILPIPTPVSTRHAALATHTFQAIQLLSGHQQRQPTTTTDDGGTYSQDRPKPQGSKISESHQLATTLAEMGTGSGTPDATRRTDSSPVHTMDGACVLRKLAANMNVWRVEPAPPGCWE